MGERRSDDVAQAMASVRRREIRTSPLSEYEVLSAAAAGKPAVLAVQTDEDRLDKLTFFEEGDRAMEAELAVVARRFAATGTPPAIAIHYYRSYRDLAP